MFYPQTSRAPKIYVPNKRIHHHTNSHKYAPALRRERRSLCIMYFVYPPAVGVVITGVDVGSSVGSGVIGAIVGAGVYGPTVG